VTISRDHESRTIVFRFHAVDARAADPRPLRRAIAVLRQKPTKKAEREVARLERALVRSVMPANPASWITADYILGQARSAKVMPADFLQLHAGIAADTVERWISADEWNGQPDAGAIPEGARVVAAVDAGLSHDSTAVAWSWETPNGVAVRAHVWSARQGSASHEFVAGGRIRNGPVKQFLRELGADVWLAAVLYDPKFFEDAAMELADEGLNMVQLAQNGGDMREAENQFYVAVNEVKVPHDRDDVLAAHVKAAVATQTDGRWKIRKVKQSEVIDGLVASIMARWGFEHVAVPYEGPLVEVLA
jgi:phage terminase large subunit-like protein